MGFQKQFYIFLGIRLLPPLAGGIDYAFKILKPCLSQTVVHLLLMLDTLVN
jgi:hypothetical protein